VADYAVSTVFKSKDGVSSTFKAMGAAATKFGRKSSESFRRADKAGMTFKKTLGAILSARVISRGTMLMGQGIRTLTEEFITFDDAITKAGAKFPVTAKRGTEAFTKLEQVARKVGSETKFSATEAAEGLNFLAMAGFNTEQAMAALPEVTKLAVVADEELARATDIASDALGSFGLMTKDNAQLTQNLARINDVFAKTVTSANTDIEMLFESMKDGGPVITAAGQSVETFAALTGKMANAGIKGTKAGTTLKNMFIKLQAPVPAARKAMKQLGLEVLDNEGKLRDIVDILGDFNDKTAKMGKAQRSAAIDTIFGKRAIAGVSVLLAEGRDELKAYRQTLIDAGGSADEMATIIQQSLGLRSAAIEAGLKIFDAFKEKVPNAIDTAVEAVRKFDIKGVIDDIKSFAKFVRDTTAALKAWWPVIETALVFTIAYKGVLKAVVAIQAIKFFIDMAGAVRAASAAQGALNVVMAANPIGLVVIAIAGLITAGVMLYRQWDNIKVLFKLLWEDLKDFGRDVKTWFAESPIGSAFISGINWIIEKWKWLKENVFGKKVAATPKIETAAGARRAKVAETMEAHRAAGEARRGAAVAAAARLPGRGGGRGIEAPPRVAPNKEDVKAQEINFFGKLTVAGAPPGSKLETETKGAPPISTELLGFNV
jgi:TP901 family phage tail tape measure protein